jgi:predicted GNAT family N-acyltransferase
MAQLHIAEISFGSHEQTESIQLRYETLREPLGLQYDKNDLAKEKEDFHIAAILGNKLVGILLLKPIDENIVKMRQVAVDKLWQGKTIGKSMVRFSEDFAREKGFEKIELHARETAIPFYLSLEYLLEGESFLEVGIPHKRMSKML